MIRFARMMQCCVPVVQVADRFIWHAQLSNEMKEARVFIGFKEGPLNFAPTFKVKREKELEYDVRTLTPAGLPYEIAL